MLTSDVFAKCIIQQETVKIGNSIQQQVTETCDDNQKFDVGAIGFSGKLDLFREHPNYKNNFQHNGVICRWFLDNQFVNDDITNYQGIICRVGDNWTVVDKF
jgi:hypothetical protein